MSVVIFSIVYVIVVLFCDSGGTSGKPAGRKMGIFLAEGGEALLRLCREVAVFGRIGVKGFVRQCLLQGAPFGKVVLGSWREVAIYEALPDVVDSLCRGVQHVGGIEAVVAELVEDELVGGEIN